MVTVSLCVITKDQAAHLEHCLKSIRDIADEIIVTNIGSNDVTKKTAAQFTHKIFDYIWNGDAAETRNFTFSKATKDYILWLEPDESLSYSNYKKLARLKQRCSLHTDVIYIKEQERGDGFATRTVAYQPRLIKRANRYVWLHPDDATLFIWGAVKYSDITIDSQS